MLNKSQSQINSIINRPVPLSKFGLKQSDIKIAKDSTELQNDAPILIMATPIRDATLMQNGNPEKTLKKKHNYVMDIPTFNFLRDDQTGRKLLSPANIKFKNVYRPYKGQDLNGKSILFIRHGGFGDLLFINTILRFIKKKYPDSYIAFSCGAQYVPMISQWPEIDGVVDSLPMDAVHFLKSDYHAIFNGVLERNEEAKRVNAYRLFANWVGLDIPGEELVPIQTPEPMALGSVKARLLEFGFNPKEFVVVHMRASSIIRTPHPEKFWVPVIRGLLDKGQKVVVIDSPDKVGVLDWFLKRYFLDNGNIKSFCRPILESISLAFLSKKVIGVDSSMVHIGASVGVPVFGIYGPFSGAVRLATYPNAKWVDAKCSCAPCFIGNDSYRCLNLKDGYPGCFNNINVEKVVGDICSAI